LWTNPAGQRGSGRPKSRWIDRVEEDARKTGCRSWRTDVQDRGRWLHFLEETKAPTQGCRADDNIDDDVEDKGICKSKVFFMHDEAPSHEVIWSSGGIAPCIHLSSRRMVSFTTWDMVPGTQTGLVGPRIASNAESKWKILWSYMKTKIDPLDFHNVFQSLHWLSYPGSTFSKLCHAEM